MTAMGRNSTKANNTKHFPTHPHYVPYGFMTTDPANPSFPFQRHQLAKSPGPPTRHDGWTKPRRVTFLVTLAASGNVTFAAAAAGLSRKSAYALRKRNGAFASLWDRSLAAATAARAEVRRRAAEGNKAHARPAPRRQVNLVNRRDADASERDRFFQSLRESGPDVPAS